MEKYVFVCYMNRNRSVTGENVLKEMFRERGRGVFGDGFFSDADVCIVSAGTYCVDSGRPFEDYVAENADRIFVMSEDILEDLVDNFDVDEGKIVNLEIPDIYVCGDENLKSIFRRKLSDYISF